MSINGKPTTERLHDYVFASEDPPKPQPLMRIEQKVNAITEHFALLEKQQALDLERLLGKVAALNSAKPIIEATVGDPNHNLQLLTRVILERGCDIAEETIELVIEDES